MQKSIKGAMLRRMIIAGVRLLEINRAAVDALNVFPVPDGDTGTNMSLTMQAALKELNATASNHFEQIADSVSKGALRGARGNSGVITSQILRGFCSSVKTLEEMDCKAFAKALAAGTEVAYSAVSKPQEGTMLTVIRLMAEFAMSNYKKFSDIEAFMNACIEAGDAALASTPEMLPVLKKAGVVDAGGKGILFIFKGMYRALLGEEIEGDFSEEKEEAPDVSENADITLLGEIEFAYCTEFFIINLKKKTTHADIERLKEKLMGIGDSVVVVGDLDFVKVHVHTNNPGNALQFALQLGELDRLKIENMLEQNRQLLAKLEAEKKPLGMLAVCAGTGIADIFKDLLVDRVIEGGQTMNPSAESIADAVRRINAENVFVLPNNKNIILAAEQAKSLVEGKNIYVIPTKNIPQGFAAALAFNPEGTVEENMISMAGALDTVAAGQVTYAVRSTNIDGFDLVEGDIIGLSAKQILAKGASVEDVTSQLIAKMKKEDHEIITLYYGNDLPEARAQEFAERVRSEHPDCEVDVYFGGQPLYYYIISLE